MDEHKENFEKKQTQLFFHLLFSTFSKHPAYRKICNILKYPFL